MLGSCVVLFRTRNLSDKSCRENQNTRFMFNNVYRKSCRLWDNVEEYGRAGQATDDNIIRRMRFTCWMTEATDTRSEYVILLAFPRQQWLRERVSLLRCTTLPFFCFPFSSRNSLCWTFLLPPSFKFFFIMLMWQTQRCANDYRILILDVPCYFRGEIQPLKSPDRGLIWFVMHNFNYRCPVPIIIMYTEF